MKYCFSIFLTCLLLHINAQIPPALNKINLSDLKKDLYDLADAHFRGRASGTLDELKASMWLGEKFREIGLNPMGEDGTYFQFFNLWRNRLSELSYIQVSNNKLQLWKEVAVSQMANIKLDGNIIFLGDAAKIDTLSADVKGKIVAIEANAEGINLNVSLPTWRYSRYIQVKYASPLIRKGAAAVLIIADEVAEKSWADATENFKLGLFDIENGVNAGVTATAPILWLHADAKAQLSSNTSTIKADLIVERYTYPSVNIIGAIPGTDKKLASEYLLYSGHQDAHGIRNSIEGDSVYYGADDNASVDVAMMAIARAFKKNPGKRSVIFVIHGAEERGLLGSRWFSAHPVIPKDQIVAVLNGDMIGRNSEDSAAILGVQSPHRNSGDLVNMALEANAEGPKFKLDTAYDKVTHVEGWYFRSDHLPYARLGIPSLMYTSLLHNDYHTPKDKAENINYTKLYKMTEWMYRTGWKVANATLRPKTDTGFKLER